MDPGERKSISWNGDVPDYNRHGLRKKVSNLADAGRNETAFWPDKVYISSIADKFFEDRDDIGVAEFISKGNLGEKADTDTG